MTNELIITKSFDLAKTRAEIERDPRLKSEHTKKGYLRDLALFEAWRAGRMLSRLLVEEYAADMQAAGRSPNTINRALAAVRWYARRAAAHLADMPAVTPEQRNERAELIAKAERAASVRDVTGTRLPAGRAVTSGERAALMATCENDPAPAGARDAAMVGVAYGAGLRRAELAGLTLDDFTLDDSGSGRLTVRGKGDKERTISVENGALAALQDWLSARGPDPGFIFCAIRKNGEAQPGHRLSGEAMRLILTGRIIQAGIKPFTWHDLRRTFAGDLLNNGVDLVTVQKLMGHSSPTTTSNYDRRGDEVLHRAVKTLFVPYHRRR